MKKMEIRILTNKEFNKIMEPRVKNGSVIKSTPLLSCQYVVIKGKRYTVKRGADVAGIKF